MIRFLHLCPTFLTSLNILKPFQHLQTSPTSSNPTISLKALLSNIPPQNPTANIAGMQQAVNCFFSTADLATFNEQTTNFLILVTITQNEKNEAI